MATEETFRALRPFDRNGTKHRAGDALPLARRWPELRKLQRNGFVSWEDGREADAAATAARLAPAPQAPAAVPAAEPDEDIPEDDDAPEPGGGEADEGDSEPPDGEPADDPDSERPKRKSARPPAARKKHATGRKRRAA